MSLNPAERGAPALASSCGAQHQPPCVHWNFLRKAWRAAASMILLPSFERSGIAGRFSTCSTLDFSAASLPKAAASLASATLVRSALTAAATREF